MTNDTMTPAQVREKLHITESTLERLREKHVLNPVGFDDKKNAHLYSAANVEHMAVNHVEPLFNYQVKYRMGNIDQVHLSKIFRTWPYDENKKRVDVSGLRKYYVGTNAYTTTTDIAAFLGVKRDTVAKWMKEARIKRHTNGWDVNNSTVKFLTKLYNYGKLLDKSVYRFPLSVNKSCSDNSKKRDFVKGNYMTATVISKFTGLKSVYLQYLARGGIIKSYKTKAGNNRYDVSAIRYINNNQDVVVKALKTGGWKNITFQQTHNKLIGSTTISKILNVGMCKVNRLLDGSHITPVKCGGPFSTKIQYRISDVRNLVESKGIKL